MPAATQPLDVSVTDVAFGGDGVARHEGLAVFLPFTVDGDQVRVRIVKRGKRFARGELLQVLTPSVHRVEPLCPVFGRCGGCRYQHMAYEHQLHIKRQQLGGALQRIGKLNLETLPPLAPSPNVYHYRNKITLHGPGRPGYVAMDNHSRLVVDQCPLAMKGINRELAALRLEGLEVAGDLLLREFADGVLATDTAQPSPTRLLRERVGDLELDVPARGFHQVNAEVAAAMACWLRERVALVNPRTLVDAYCGAGLFSLALSDAVACCLGIEANGASVEAARHNARRLGREHSRFLHGRTEALLPGVLDDLEGASTCLLLDPPRTGCDPAVLRAASQHQVAHLAYISCNPPVLARDLALLEQAGYCLSEVQGFDLFPQTAHFEVIAWLRWGV